MSPDTKPSIDAVKAAIATAEWQAGERGRLYFDDWVIVLQAAYAVDFPPKNSGTV